MNPRQGRTIRIKIRNPADQAEELAEKFHGREIRDVIDIAENYHEPGNLAELGQLEELVVNPFGSKYEYPISFEEQMEDENQVIRLCSDSSGKQLYFVGGNQDIDDIVQDIASDPDSGLSDENRQYNILGICNAVSYYTDKHHLTGPKSQADGCSYEHEFSEVNKEDPKPILVYDTLNKRLMLLGGSYDVRDVGIYN